MMSSGKRKREDFPSKYNSSGYIPQQDGAGDPAPEVFEVDVLPSFISHIKSCFLISC